jgi:hypothetical protein
MLRLAGEPLSKIRHDAAQRAQSERMADLPALPAPQMSHNFEFGIELSGVFRFATSMRELPALALMAWTRSPFLISVEARNAERRHRAYS